MTVQVVFPSWLNPRGKKALNAFMSGLKALGVPHKKISLLKAKPSKDPMVCWGVFKTKLKSRQSIQFLQDGQKAVGGELLIVERGFVNRQDYYMVAWDDINGRGRYPHDDTVPRARWDVLGVDLKPWREGSEILVVGQVPWDTACQHQDHATWVSYTCQLSRKVYPDCKIVFRPHPLQPNAIPVGVLDIDAVDRTRPLPEALARAKLVVTFSSNVGVLATIAGRPVIANDKTSMVYEIWEPGRGTEFPSRQPWANWLAYCQWNLKEMAAGLPWRHFHG